MYPLIVTAACTGMRRGDVCSLKWADVDLDAGMLGIKTSKTQAHVEIPIFQPLREILESARSHNDEYVFPEAAEMLRRNPDGLTWRFKKIVTRALASPNREAQWSEAPAAESIRSEASSTIEKGVQPGERRDRMLDVVHRYCVGASIRQIVKDTGYCKATVSNDLHAIECMIGQRVIRHSNTNMAQQVHSTTRVARETGQRAASIRDWHALRATYVTLALAAGVPVELVRRVTGHATVDIVLKHYFHPDREQFKSALNKALPEILTGASQLRSDAPVIELASLAAKLAQGTATAQDRARLRQLAAAV